jgi:SAM-dependent methyltransferase
MRTPRYTHGHHESVLRSHSWRSVENSAAYLLPELRAGRSVLDVGCGPGTITLDLARRVAPATVVGIDTSADVLDGPRRMAARAALDVRFEVADIYRLDIPDGSFDVVHAHQVLQHVPDPVEALRSMRRVCAPGGVVAARDADYAAMTWYPRVPELDRWLELYRRIARANGGEPDAGRRLLGWAQVAGVRGGPAECFGLVPCHPGGTAVVGRDVGGPDRLLGDGRAGGGRGVRRRR